MISSISVQFPRALVNVKEGRGRRCRTMCKYMRETYRDGGVSMVRVTNKQTDTVITAHGDHRAQKARKGGHGMQMARKLSVRCVM